MLPDINDKDKVLEYLQRLNELCYYFYVPTDLKQTTGEVSLITVGNDNLIDWVEWDTEAVQQAIKDNFPIKRLKVYSIAPIQKIFGIADRSIYTNLLSEKFDHANRLSLRYPRKEMFSKHEAENFKSKYEKYFDLLPILTDWISFLESFAEENETAQEEILITPEIKKLKERYCLLLESGIIEHLHKTFDGLQFDRPKKEKLIALILGVDAKQVHLSVAYENDKKNSNYPGKAEIVNDVWSKLNTIGINKPTKGKK